MIIIYATSGIIKKNNKPFGGFGDYKGARVYRVKKENRSDKHRRPPPPSWLAPVSTVSVERKGKRSGKM